jgi:RNA polymerase sigma factor (sigma-70 family)
MGRRKVVRIASREDREKYDKYIKPNHSLVKNTVAMLTLKASEISDNFQDICVHLLRYIHTLDPKNSVANWIITSVRREVGKLEAAKDSYVDARKGGDNEYVTEHTGYKAKYRPAAAKDFVSSYDDSVFKSKPSSIDFNNGVGDRLMTLLQDLLPNTDFGTGTYREVIDSISNSGDIDIRILFMKYYYGVKVREISEELNMTDSEVKNALSRAKNRIKKIR